jgi:hypothetical protein
MVPMPSPFPGMDPWLEGPLWQSLHVPFVVEMARQLGPQLQPRYITLFEQRVVWETPDAEEGLSIATERRPDIAVHRSRADDLGTGAPAQAVLEAPVRMTTLIPEPMKQYSLEIREAATRTLVCAIEMLSPTNKRSGYRDYLEKRTRLLCSDAHLIEIDLLRAGRRVPMREPLAEEHYFVFVSRAGRRPSTETWPIGVRQALPKIPVPLLPGDADATLNLQQALNAAYDLVGFRYGIDYKAPPPTPLAPEDAAWAEGLLASERGSGALRS